MNVIQNEMFRSKNGTFNSFDINMPIGWNEAVNTLHVYTAKLRDLT